MLSDFVFTPGTLRRIKELVRLNVREQAICVDLGCDIDTLRRIAKKHGVDLKPPKPDEDDGKPDSMPYQRSSWPTMRGGDDR